MDSQGLERPVRHEALNLARTLLCETSLCQKEDWKLGSAIYRNLILTSPNKLSTYSLFDDINSRALADFKFTSADMDFFISQCWNYGVYFSRMQSFNDAEKFLSLSLRILRFSPVLQSTFSDDLEGSYSVILKLMKNTDTLGGMEE